MDNQVRPSNCENAKPPRVNSGIWRQLKKYTKKRDIRVFKLQQALDKGIYPIVRIIDMAMSLKNLDGEHCKQVKKLALEAMSLLTHVHSELNVHRRLLMKADIGKVYAPLCSPDVPVTDFLFGDDLQKQLKDIGDQNKIGAAINPSHGHGKGRGLPKTLTVRVFPEGAGNIANCLRAWKQLTTDEVLLKIVTGYELEFDQTPSQSKIPHKTHLDEEEFQIINTEINKLLHKGVIVKTNHSEGEFISDIFCRPKKDGSHRLILNLKNLNDCVEYHHFKMETFQNVL